MMEIELISKVWIIESLNPFSLRNHKDVLVQHEKGTVMYAARMTTQLGDKILLFDRTNFYPMLTENYCKEMFRLVHEEDSDLMEKHFKRALEWKPSVRVSLPKVKKG